MFHTIITTSSSLVTLADATDESSMMSMSCKPFKSLRQFYDDG